MPAKEEIAQIKERMGKAVEDLRRELSSIRTGRASLALFNNINVDYYGVPTPINQVATLAIPEPSLVTLQPFDVSLIGNIEKGDSGFRPGPESGQRRTPDPDPDTCIERRKTAAVGQARPQSSRRPQNRRSQYSP